MSRVEFAPEVGDDLDRILEHLLQHQVAEASSRIEDIMRAIDVLERNPLIGRPVRADLRELVIGRRARGYVALYRFLRVRQSMVFLHLGQQSVSQISSPSQQ